MVGRQKETEILNRLYNSDESQFVALYGRRRVGKTYLVNELFHDRLTFKHAGISPVENELQDSKSPLKNQLKNFYNSLILWGMKPKRCPTDWMEAFLMLELFLQSKDDGTRQLVFIDELPWMDTQKSGFIPAFEAFWNNWACSRKNIMLIVCGSANSWMMDKLINNHGGLYNRITYEMKLEPFTLKECEMYFQSRNVRLSRYDVTNAYMICGGIPYYLSYFYGEYSLAQNIDNLFFKKNAPLSNEFDRLFNSIFTNPDFMKSLVKIIGKKRIGYTRDEIVKEAGIVSNGMLTEALKALIASGFVTKYVPFGSQRNKEFYKLIDPFCNFYLKFMDGKNEFENDFWLTNISSQNVVSWRGIAFESVCFSHVEQIKKALGISGVSSQESAWSKSDEDEEGTQIDMIINRKDNVVNMCEMKFYGSEVMVDKKMDKQIRYKSTFLQNEIPKKSVVHNTLVTTFGLKKNEYSDVFLNVITLDDLFD
jgi:AAA+ ATPase superfamily predicted ATPase